MSSQDLISQWDFYTMHGETPGDYGETPGEHGPPPAMAPADRRVPSYERSQQVVGWALDEAKDLFAEAIAEKAEGSSLPPGVFCFHTATAKVARRQKRVNKLTALCASISTRRLYTAVRDGVCQTEYPRSSPSCPSSSPLRLSDPVPGALFGRVHLRMHLPRLSNQLLTL